jgi:octanoyl-[GcvH]:protein N-octanoyltransferase
LRLLSGPLAGVDGPAMEMALSHALLRQASRGELGATLRVFRPATKLVAFGRRDTNRPGFGTAAQACREAGFTPVIRASGGRAVACTGAAVVLDHVSPDHLSPSGLQGRFEHFGELLAGVLRGLGIDARVGEVPGEYCPGAHSVNARGRAKLVGTAQRMVRNAWLFSSVVVFDDAAPVRSLLGTVYAALELPFDPDSVGSVHEESPGTTLDELEQALLGAYAVRFGLEPTTLDDATLAEARTMVDDHRVG